MPQDTIIAISSPPGRSARGLIRLSGPGAADVLARLLQSVPDAPRCAHFVRLRAPLPEIPAILIRFAGPASYTGEDCAELQVPGNPSLLDRILQAATLAEPNRPSGCRLAHAGEFTFRAWQNGKMDLTRAEGVAATIHAHGEAELRAATLLRRGALAKQTESQVEALGRLLALVEAGIDFTDQDDVVPISPADLDGGLAKLEDTLAGLLARSRSWGTLEAAPRVVLVGRPSAGKSTLFNALLGRTRAVVHAEPGTTRDALEEKLTLPGGTEVMLVDIAGLDDAQTRLDAAAQEQAQAAIGRADLVLEVDDATDPQAQWPAFGGPSLRVMTKADLAQAGWQATGGLPVCAPQGTGLLELKQALAEALKRRHQSAGASELALQPRHEEALRGALAQVREARATLAPHVGDHALPAIERVAGSLRAGLDALAGLGGTLTPDEVIGKVFATFCVGK